MLLNRKLLAKSLRVVRDAEKCTFFQILTSGQIFSLVFHEKYLKSVWEYYWEYSECKINSFQIGKHSFKEQSHFKKLWVACRTGHQKCVVRDAFEKQQFTTSYYCCLKSFHHVKCWPPLDTDHTVGLFKIPPTGFQRMTLKLCVVRDVSYGTDFCVGSHDHPAKKIFMSIYSVT